MVQGMEANTNRRIATTVERNDLMVNAIAAKEKFGTSYEDLRSQATTLVLVSSLALFERLSLIPRCAGSPVPRRQPLLC